MRNGIAAAAVIASLVAGCAGRTATPPASGTGSSAPAQTQLTPRNLEELMKRIGPTYESLLKHLQANDTAEAAKEGRDLAEWFGGVEKFWAQRQRENAVQWAERARTHATEAAGAAATGDGQTAETSARAMASACKQCHATYRESDGAGGYRLRLP